MRTDPRIKKPFLYPRRPYRPSAVILAAIPAVVLHGFYRRVLGQSIFAQIEVMQLLGAKISLQVPFNFLDV